jgi:murein L,D-transpeptidase YafK
VCLDPNAVETNTYYIIEFNPSSNDNHSLGPNFPNKSDSILGDKGNLGVDISSHGGCESFGSLPIITRLIKEFYVMVLQARYFGQKKPVLSFLLNLETIITSKYQKGTIILS